MGSNPANKMDAPFDDPDWTIWACSAHNAPPHQELPRVDEFFEVHVPATDKTRSTEYLAWVKALTHKMPVWMRDREGYPDSKEYPEKALKDRFGPFFFTSTISYMLAQAISEGPEAIGIWGVLQASENEWTYQRPGVQYFLQKAHDAGIRVVIPPESRLFRLPEEKW